MCVSSVSKLALSEQLLLEQSFWIAFLMLELHLCKIFHIHSPGSRLGWMVPSMTSRLKPKGCQQGHRKFHVWNLTSFFPVPIQSKMLLTGEITLGQWFASSSKISQLPGRMVASIPCFPFPLLQFTLYFLFNVIRYMILTVSLIYSWQD